MVGGPDEVGALADGEVVLDVGLINRIGEVLHLIPDVNGEEIRSDNFFPLQPALPVQLVNVLQAHHLEKIRRFRDTVVIRSQHP